jgi:hypothetical protein
LANGHYQHISAEDAAYIVHACNSYPKMIAVLRRIAKPTLGGKHQQYDAQALLGELGESL